MTGLARLIALGALSLPPALPADAQGTTPQRPPRVRGEDAQACEILEKARSLSPTVARLIAEVEDTDVIVLIVAGWLPGRAKGSASVVATAAAVRYVRIVLRLPADERRVMAVLGHELQHAVEIGHMPAVRDGRSLADAYARVGVPMARHTNFETEAAVNAGRQVSRELARKR